MAGGVKARREFWGRIDCDRIRPEMPLRNRVLPDGEIVALAARGTFMGNRGGVIHNDRKEIVRPYASRRWIACVLEFRGRRRVVMSPHRYTELFFLDEATALAAGHRPCAECRRARFNEFKEAWRRGKKRPADEYVYADEMDEELHPARIGKGRRKITYEAALRSMPDGCFVQLEGASYLVWENVLARWSAEGYREMLRRPGEMTVTVLTPEPIVRCIRNGYRPAVHESIQAAISR